MYQTPLVHTPHSLGRDGYVTCHSAGGRICVRLVLLWHFFLPYLTHSAFYGYSQKTSCKLVLSQLLLCGVSRERIQANRQPWLSSHSKQMAPRTGRPGLGPWFHSRCDFEKSRLFIQQVVVGTYCVLYCGAL